MQPPERNFITSQPTCQARPRPLLGARDQASPQGITLDIRKDGQQMLIFSHGQCLETTLVPMAATGTVVEKKTGDASIFGSIVRVWFPWPAARLAAAFRGNSAYLVGRSVSFRPTLLVAAPFRQQNPSPLQFEGSKSHGEQIFLRHVEFDEFCCPKWPIHTFQYGTVHGHFLGRNPVPEHSATELERAGVRPGGDYDHPGCQPNIQQEIHRIINPWR
jgi:hypothetical protein